MKLSVNEESIPKDEQSLLELINKDRTDINEVKFLSHYELSKDKNNTLVHLTSDVKKFMIQLRNDQPLIETRIDSDGEFSNFLFRLKNSKILNSVNILKYITSEIPFELRSIPDGSKIYTIKYFAAYKEEITEEECDELVENDELVIMEEEKYIHIQYNDEKSLEKYWSDSVFKAVYFLKKQGFYTGLNHPDKNVNLELLREYTEEPVVYMFARNPLDIDNLKNITVVQITERTIPTNLKFLIKKKYKKFQNRVKKIQPLTSRFVSTKEHDLVPDEIGLDFGEIKDFGHIPKSLKNKLK